MYTMRAYDPACIILIFGPYAVKYIRSGEDIEAGEGFADELSSFLLLRCLATGFGCWLSSALPQLTFVFDLSHIYVPQGTHIF